MNAVYTEPLTDVPRYFPKCTATGCNKILEANLTYFKGVSTTDERHSLHFYVCKHGD